MILKAIGIYTYVCLPKLSIGIILTFSQWQLWRVIRDRKWRRRFFFLRPTRWKNTSLNTIILTIFRDNVPIFNVSKTSNAHIGGYLSRIGVVFGWEKCIIIFIFQTYLFFVAISISIRVIVVIVMLLLFCGHIYDYVQLFDWVWNEINHQKII